jgi:REP element-mobilizing transposase RayT
MAKTYTQIYIQIVFAVEGGQNLTQPAHKEGIQKYMTGVLLRRNQKALAIHCMPDHTHILIGMTPDATLSDLVRDIRTATSNLSNDQKWIRGRFHWQEGFGAFSYSRSQVNQVIQHIQNQEKHHGRASFREEYLSFLKRFGVEYDERFIFKFE